MHIVVLTENLSPYTEHENFGQSLAALCERFINEDHKVSVLMPLPEGCEIERHSLARRLTPSTFELDGSPLAATRFDGRTANGVDVHLLELPKKESGDSNDAWQAHCFAKAVLSVMKGYTVPVDWCILATPYATRFPALAHQSDVEVVANTKHQLFLDDFDSYRAGTLAACGVVDNVVLTRCAADAVRHEGVEPIYSMLKEGAVAVLPVGVEKVEPAAAVIRPSLKASFQVEIGLPVKEATPLYYLVDAGDEPVEDVLESLLEHNVQVICGLPLNNPEKLNQRYSDRLAVVTASRKREKILRAVDCVIAGRDLHIALKGLSSGAVPIILHSAAEQLVDLEDSLQSGSAVVIPTMKSRDIERGVLRMLAAFGHVEAYDELVSRLPKCVLTWTTVAQQHLSLMV